MTVKEVISLLYLEKNLYPRDRSLDRSREELTAMAKAQAELLKDIPFELGQAAVAAHGASSPYAPAICEIRAYARRMTEPPRLSADEAWALAYKAIRTYGSSPYKHFKSGKYSYELARDSLPPEVWRVVELMGYDSMCKSERTEVIRGQFIQAWERQQRLREERENLLPFLPAPLREKVLALEERTGS